MEFIFKKAGNIIMIYLKGRLDVHHSADIEQELAKLITGEPKSHFLINMKDVEYISSSGLRIIVITMKTLKKENRQMALCCVNDVVSKVFKVTELIEMFNIYDFERKALEFLEGV